MPFHSRPDLLVRTQDGRNVILQEPLEFVRGSDLRRFRAPVGTTSDGASTPAALWPTIPPFGAYWRAAVLHDAAYRGALDTSDDGLLWRPAFLGKDECDALFFEAMECLGVTLVEAQTIYQGVHIMGGGAFNADRAS